MAKVCFEFERVVIITGHFISRTFTRLLSQTTTHTHRPTSGVFVRDARLYSLSLELLSDSSVSDSELLSDSLLLPDAALLEEEEENDKERLELDFFFLLIQ